MNNFNPCINYLRHYINDLNRCIHEVFYINESLFVTPKKSVTGCYSLTENVDAIKNREGNDIFSNTVYMLHFQKMSTLLHLA